MAVINKRFIHFNKKSDFEKRRAAGDIQETSIVFIGDTNEIWTHGAFYTDGASSLTGDRIVEKLNNMDEIIFTKHVACLGGAGMAAMSDIRFKNNREPMDPVLPLVLGAPVFKYNWKDNPEKSVGSSAQYWREEIPELGFEVADDDRTQALSYELIGGVIMPKALQEEHAERILNEDQIMRELERLRNVNKSIRNEIGNLKKLVAGLMGQVLELSAKIESHE